MDYVLQSRRKLWAIEVKSGRPRSVRGLERFRGLYPQAKALVIGGEGLSLEEFFSRPPADFFS